jgi:hypothetical protein
MKTINVKINWQVPIPVDHFVYGLTLYERIISYRQNVVYYFEGTNDRKQRKIDIGQTTQSLFDRTKQHILKKDYLEGAPKEQTIRCGIVSIPDAPNVPINRELLEQVEGELIQYLSENMEEPYMLCNNNKTQDIDRTYNIVTIANIGNKGFMPQIIRIKI